MKLIKGILALGLFFLFAPLFLFSIGAVFVLIWPVISFILLFVIPVFIFGFLFLIFIGFILAIIEDRKNKKFRETFKTYKYNRVPSQFYLYR